MQQVLTVKQQAEALLHTLPDESSIDDIQYHLYLLDKVCRGQKDAAERAIHSQDEAKQRLAKWLD